MVISPEEELYKVGTFEQVLGGEATNEDESGGVVAIRSMEINLQDGKPAGTGIAERVFTSTAGDTAREIHIWEETGESIARHVWYATPDPDRYVTLSSLTDFGQIGTPALYYHRTSHL